MHDYEMRDFKVRRCINEIFTLLGCSLSQAVPLKMEPIDCPETSVTTKQLCVISQKSEEIITRRSNDQRVLSPRPISDGLNNRLHAALSTLKIWQPLVYSRNLPLSKELKVSLLPLKQFTTRPCPEPEEYNLLSHQ